MSKWLFDKNEHVDIIKAIAVGLKKANSLDVYLELGIRKGPCFNAIAPLAKLAYAVDVDNCKKYISHNKNLKWFHTDTDTFFKNINKNVRFDLVFIDACHSYDASYRDFDNVIPYVNANGIVLLHDTYPYTEELTNIHLCNDTYKTPSYIKQKYDYEVLTLPFYFGITIIRKITKQLLWK